jgi:hypothetical protein
MMGQTNEILGPSYAICYIPAHSRSRMPGRYEKR